MKMWKRWKAVLLAGMMACTAVAASVPAIGTLNAQAEEDPIYIYIPKVSSRK